MGRDGFLCQCQRQGIVGSVGSGRTPASAEGASGRTDAKRTNGIAPAGGLMLLWGWRGECQVESKCHC